MGDGLAKAKARQDEDTVVRLDTSESEEELAQIKEARFASRRAIDDLITGLKKKHDRKIWVPTGD